MTSASKLYLYYFIAVYFLPKRKYALLSAKKLKAYSSVSKRIFAIRFAKKRGTYFIRLNYQALYISVIEALLYLSYHGLISMEVL